MCLDSLYKQLNPSHVINLLDLFMWPLILIVLIFIYRKRISALTNTIAGRIESGAEFQISSFKLGQVPSYLKSPIKDEVISGDHIALLHSSWRYPKADEKYKKKMYCIQVVVQANDDVLDKIDYVEYILDPTYPLKNQRQKKTNRIDSFELKELAWGEYIIKADVKVIGQENLIRLSRYINLTEKGVDLLREI